MILEIIQVRCLYLFSSRQNHIVTKSLQHRSDFVICYNGNVRRGCKNDAVATVHYDVSLWDFVTLQQRCFSISSDVSIATIWQHQSEVKQQCQNNMSTGTYHRKTWLCNSFEIRIKFLTSLTILEKISICSAIKKSIFLLSQVFGVCSCC